MHGGFAIEMAFYFVWGGPALGQHLRRLRCPVASAPESNPDSRLPITATVGASPIQSTALRQKLESCSAGEALRPAPADRGQPTPAQHQPLGARGHRPSERHRFPCGTISVTQSLCRRRGLHEKPSVQAPARRTTTRHTHAPESVRAFAQHRRRTLTPQPYC